MLKRLGKFLAICTLGAVLSHVPWTTLYDWEQVGNWKNYHQCASCDRFHETQICPECGDTAFSKVIGRKHKQPIRMKEWIETRHEIK